MTFTLDTAQRDFRDAVRAFLGRHCTTEHVRAGIATADGHDPSLYRRMAAELGLQGIAIPEEFGGVGATSVELGIVLSELGRAVVPGPFFSSVVLAAQTLLASDDPESCRKWLPGIANGSTRATFAVHDAPGQVDSAAPQVVARPIRKDRWALTGKMSLVVDGATADLILVAAQTESGPSLFGVAPVEGSTVRLPLESLDLARRFADIEFLSAPAYLVGGIGDGTRIRRLALDRAAIGLASEQAGGAARCLEMACEYAKIRVQFDRAIGSFQSVKHLLADLFVDVESAAAAAHYASWTIDHAPQEVAATSALSKAFASDTYLAAANASIQVHGGIAFTWEHDAHLHFRKATSTAQFLGSAQLHRERLAQHVFDRSRLAV